MRTSAVPSSRAVLSVRFFTRTLLAASMFITVAVGPTRAAEPSALSRDLDLIPRDAVGFVSVRLGALLERPEIKRDYDILKHNFMDVTDRFGIDPLTIDRLTFVLLRYPPAEASWFALVTCNQNFDLTKIESALAAKSAVAFQHSVSFLDERMLLVAAPAGMPKLLADLGKQTKTGPLAASLTPHAVDHVLSAGFNPRSMIIATGEDLSDQALEYKPLWRTRLAVLNFDLADNSNLELALNFDNHNEAVQGERAMNKLLVLARMFVGRLVQQAESSTESPAPLDSIVKTVYQAMLQAKPECRAERVHLPFRMKTEPGPFVSAVTESVRALSEGTARTQSQKNLRRLALAINAYRHAHGNFPPAALTDASGKALLSWRVLVLPYLGEEGLYEQFRLDESWDSAHNRPLLGQMPSVFSMDDSSSAHPWETHYQVLVGVGAAFDGLKGRTIGEFHDGIASTLLIVEARQTVPWSKPTDLPYDAKKPLPQLGGVFTGGFHAAYADGTVRFLERTALREASLRGAISRSGGEPVSVR